MKFLRVLPFVIIVLTAFLLNRYLPTEEEREAEKYKEIDKRNFLEKQLVGKWNFSDYPAGKDKHYHLLSADGSYTFQGSNNSRRFGKSWKVRVLDSVLFLDRGAPENDLTYKIITIDSNRLLLQVMEKDSLTYFSEWTRFKN